MKQSIKYYTQLCGILLAVLAISGCKKDEAKATFDNNKINLVIADNFNLSSFNAVLRKSGVDRVLQDQEGPFTMLAPSDAAFVKAGYAGPAVVLGAGNAIISSIANYHTLDGKYELNKLPYLFNQELVSRGGKLYATHWIKGVDTVLTLNGARVLSVNLPASNGLVQVLDRMLTPYVHDVISDAISADGDITLFAQALKVSGLMETIRKGGPYTVFAPTNTAMSNLGYSSVQQIQKTDPMVLKAMLTYHIVEDRRFIYDYILSTGASNTAQQGMMDGNSVTIKLQPNTSSPGSFSGITLRGTGNTRDVTVLKQDMLTGNGILHVISDGLRITQ
jgi:uncharacterized surface protein with fasciclin (FAS1) repeats